MPVLLLIPFAGNLISPQVEWDINDFLVMGTLLLAAGLSLEFILRKVSNQTTRTLVIILLVLAFLLLWAEMAVGIFGSPLAGN